MLDPAISLTLPVDELMIIDFAFGVASVHVRCLVVFLTRQHFVDSSHIVSTFTGPIG